MNTTSKPWLTYQVTPADLATVEASLKTVRPASFYAQTHAALLTCGMLPDQAAEVMFQYTTDRANDHFVTRWADDAEGYPEGLKTLIVRGALLVAREVTEAKWPNAWFRPVFDAMLTGESDLVTATLTHVDDTETSPDDSSDAGSVIEHSPSPVHIDVWINDAYSRGKNKHLGEDYAAWFFHLHRLSASAQDLFSEQISKYKLFCVHAGTKYRVTGCSRLGDVWLSRDFSRDHGYDFRVYVDTCSHWSRSFSTIKLGA